MNRSIYTFVLALAGGFCGFHLANLSTVTAANHQPVLTGGGASIPNSVVFMENAAPASIGASSGALTVSAGGSNQNIVLKPSGTGVTSSASPFLVDLGAAPTSSQWVAKANALGALALISRGADNQQIFFDAERSGGNTVARDTTAAAIRKTGGQLVFGYNSGLTPGNTFTFSTGPVIDLTSGNMCFGGNATCTYAVDATGDVNASGVFRNGGTAGQTVTRTMCKTGACVTTCTIIFTGGIATGGTC